MVGESHAYTLSDGNSTLQVDLGTSAGVSAWDVNGVDYLNQQWFYYRVGPSGPEYPIQNISTTPTVSQTLDNQLEVVYANPDFSVEVFYQLTDSSGKSQLNLSFAVVNLSGSPLDFHFYQYADFDLSGTPGDDSSRFFKVGTRYSRVIQTEPGIVALTNSLTSGLTPATHAEAGLNANTLGKLTDANPTTLTDAMTAGPGNATYAVQWDYTLAAYGLDGNTLAISQVLGLTVPEPSTLALLVAGGLCVTWRRQARR